MKHDFAMRRIEDTSDEHADAYLCHCVRCKWTFEANPESVSTIALDGAGEPLDDDAEASKRIDSFARGLCPAYRDLLEYAEALATSHHSILGILQSVLHLLGLGSAAQ